MWDESRFSIAAGVLCDCRETKPGLCGRVEEEMRIPIWMESSESEPLLIGKRE